MANIMDLLMDWKNVTRKNEDISKLYILYQTFLMVCSILTPGTIFLMILGAITMAFPAIPPFAAMTINIIPVIGMVMLCFVAKTNVQLAYAAIVSTAYSLYLFVIFILNDIKYYKLEEGKQLFYNFIYLRASATFGRSPSSEGSDHRELVMEVVQDQYIKFCKKEIGNRNQLWRMTSGGMLEH